MQLPAAKLAAVALLALCASCDRAPETPAPSTSPTTAATVPTTKPTTAKLTISDRDYLFAAPVAAIRGTDEEPRLLIYSDEENATGTFYFEVPGEVGGNNTITWQLDQEYALGDREESLIGIDLQTPPLTLQPTRLQITATPAGPGLMRIQLTGRFRIYGPESDIAIASTQAQADFLCTLKDQ